MSDNFEVKERDELIVRLRERIAELEAQVPKVVRPVLNDGAEDGITTNNKVGGEMNLEEQLAMYGEALATGRIGNTLCYVYKYGDGSVDMNGRFTIDELKALLGFMQSEIKQQEEK